MRATPGVAIVEVMKGREPLAVPGVLVAATLLLLGQDRGRRRPRGRDSRTARRHGGGDNRPSTRRETDLDAQLNKHYFRKHGPKIATYVQR